jgi:hypothetical protein
MVLASATPNIRGDLCRDQSGANELVGTPSKLVKLQTGDESKKPPNLGCRLTRSKLHHHILDNNGRVLSARWIAHSSSSNKTLGNRLARNETAIRSMVEKTSAKCPPCHFTTRSLPRSRMCAATPSKRASVSYRGMSAGGYYELEPVHILRSGGASPVGKLCPKISLVRALSWGP